MEHPAEILFALIRSAFGECDNSSNAASLRGIRAEDWRKVIDLAFEQGIAAIAVDGLQQRLEVRDEGLDLLDSLELEDLKYEWFGNVFQAESDFAAYLSAAKSLAKLYAEMA